MTSPPSTAWSVSGRVTSQTGMPISGATVTASGLAQVQTDVSGNYKFAGNSPPANQPYSVDIRASGYVDRRVWVTYQRADRTGVDIDMISMTAPFSLDFYRQLARDNWEEPGTFQPLYLWPGGNPKVYVRTVDQNGKAIEPEVLDGVYAVIPRAIRDWTAGKRSMASLEHGTATRSRQDGWLIIEFTHDYAHNVCGQSYVGAPAGYINLVDDICECGSNKMPGQVVAHEIGHAMGFFHVDDPSALMYPQIAGCPPGALTDRERYHTKVAWSRQRGNLDPDTDPSSGIALSRREVLVDN